ncbi:hypothetical protein PVAND_012819 [Polypedilum vanderplanki]|uniref:Uncharacterized protein n=1 Tax=Polypedilum vanderplanki TaxID=319348 RepID=A0A9J6CMT0_POLVA|nr:hypothetical protein PVAND_012819 [Polypedilum vanderplanki]
MNKEKILIRIRDIPINIPIKELGNAIIRLMSFNKLNSRELAGLITERTEHEDVMDLYVFFTKKSTINDFKRRCHTINGYYYLLLHNEQLVVEFAGRQKAFLKTSKYDDVESRVLMIKHQKFQDITDILEVLPQYHFYEEDNNKIISIIQTGNVTFIKFKRYESIDRVMKAYTRHGFEAKLSETYTYIERIENKAAELGKF